MMFTSTPSTFSLIALAGRSFSTPSARLSQEHVLFIKDEDFGEKVGTGVRKLIFRYNSEQEIIREGKRQRCMEDRYFKLNKQIEIIKKRINKPSDIVMEGLLAVIAIFGVIEVFSKGMEWNTVFVCMIVGLLAIEAIRWYKTRNLSDL